MGVDFFPCDGCGETICDCGDYVRCNEHCYRTWCTMECAEEDGLVITEDNGEDYSHYSCRYCRKESYEDYDVVNYLVKKYNINLKELYVEMKENGI